ncbi:MAG: hypothetical protein EP330_23965 [Deltaproteobacteria bacterium]|nr:MAG: hypothetical protein EP330_23965 [Deltaproteobacteria bacterium]
MEALLRWLGVQPRPFRALLRTFVALDLRGQFYGLATGAKAGELVSPLYWVVGQMLTVSLLLTALMQGRVEAWFYAFASLSATAVMVFSAVVVEFQEAAFDPKDITVVGHRPVSSRTWSLARGLNLSLYVALIGVAMTLFPTGMGLGLRDTEVRWLWLFPWANAVVAVGTAALALTVYASGSVAGPGENLKKVAAWVQILAIMALFYGGQLMLRDGSGGIGLVPLHLDPWVSYVPTLPLGHAVADGALRPLFLGTSVSTLLTVVAWAALRRAWERVSRVRSTDREVRVSAPPRAGTLSRPLVARLLGGRRPAAVHALVRTVLARDSELRARLVTVLAMPAAAAVLGPLTAQYAPPSQQSTTSVLPLATVALLASTLPTAMHALKASRDHRAAWRLAEVWGPSGRSGARTALLSWLYWPFVLAHAGLCAWWWSAPVEAALHGLVGLALLDFVSRLAAHSLWVRPILSVPPVRGGTLGGALGVVAGVGALASVLGGLWFAVAPWPLATAGFAALLAVAGQFVDREIR